MKQFVASIIFVLCAAPAAHAQSFLNHLKQKNQGEGTITVTQSAAIDELVNGTKPASVTTTPTVKPATPLTSASAKQEASTSTNEKRTEPEQKRTEPETKRPETAANANATSPGESENETQTVDMRKKVMRGSYKVNGYRVQAFAGGNSRADKQKAEQAGRDVKMKYPDLPVYVHFYSPQWKCRVGNFRTYEEANRVLKGIRAMGYKQACIVKGKISVQY
jgi:hypothetical protein